jgi:hypothetical protein
VSVFLFLLQFWSRSLLLLSFLIFLLFYFLSCYFSPLFFSVIISPSTTSHRLSTTHRQSDSTCNTRTTSQPWSYEHSLCALSAPCHVLLFWTSRLVFFLSETHFHFFFSGCLSVWHFAYSHIAFVFSFRVPYSGLGSGYPCIRLSSLLFGLGRPFALSWPVILLFLFFISLRSPFALTWTKEVLSGHLALGRCLEPR